MEFIYDQSGIAGIKYNNATYFYRKDAQGNIIALLDSSGNTVVKYRYDAWGNHAVQDENGADIADASHIGNRNPFRYRGYYYDTETELYYLQTRYYDPETGRFITIDGIEYLDPKTINGLNLYAYCGNNPVMNVDPMGTQASTHVVAVIFSILNYQNVSWYSGRYKIKTIPRYNPSNPFAHFSNNIKYYGELLLSKMDLRVMACSASILTITSSNIAVFSVGIDALDGRFYVNNTDYLGVKIGSAKFEIININYGSETGFTLIDAKATALTVGVYSEYVDAELLIGSVSATLGFENGTLKIGVSLGIGFELTIRFW